MNYPILMADIISSRKEKPSELLSDFKRLIGFINKKWSKEILSPLTITLGDEFQCVINTIENGLKIIFDIEEQIIKDNLNFKLRYVLNYGEIDTQINKKVAHEMLGSGLFQTREKLNELKTSKNRFKIILEHNQNAQEVLNELFKLYENYVDNWKQNELHIVKEFIQNKHYKEVAKILNMNISSSWKRYKSLNIEEYFICKKLILHLKLDLIYV